MRIEPSRLRITRTDTQWHTPFFRFIREIFPRATGMSWDLWEKYFGWDDRYEVLALVLDGGLVATMGRTRMRLVVDGEERAGIQLGAVATRADLRGRGLARALMGWMTEELEHPDQPVILFANDSVLEFYPRFGFRRVMQTRFVAKAPIRPAGNPVKPFDIANPGDRARLAALAARAPVSGWRFGARDYYSILLWHLTNRPHRAFWLEDLDGWIATETKDERLMILDAIANRPRPLREILPCVIDRPIAEATFGFDPEALWPAADLNLSAETDHPLFVRGLDLADGPLRFPDLAQT